MTLLPNSLFMQITLPDGGPLYTETNLNQFIAEPFNAVSAFFFLLIVAYWVWKIRDSWRDHLFIAIALPILLIGGIGGTGYHAFRASQLLLVMDWLPIMLLCIAGSGYFLVQLRIKWWGLLAAIAGIAGLQWLNFLLTPPEIAVNVSYGILALSVLAPVSLFLFRTEFRESQIIALGFIAFLLAIFFRITDIYAWMPMGTHFLWHTFGALACHFTILYVYRERVSRPAQSISTS